MICHQVGNIEFKNFNTILSSILTQSSPDTNIILGHNINANVGTSSNNRQHFKETIGTYGIENRNKKGISLINLMASLSRKITNSFFNPRPSDLDATTTHTTWRNPNASKSQHMLDVFSCSNTFFNRVQGCNPTRKGAESNHTAVILKIHINKLAFKMKDKKLTTKTDWEKILNDETTNAIYNKKLQEITNTNKDNNDTQEEYTKYFKNVKRAGKETATKTIKPPMDWFEASKDKIQPRIDTVTSILKQLRQYENEHTKSRLQKELKMANKIRNIVIAEAKESYMSKLADQIARLAGTNSKAAWKAVREWCGARVGGALDYIPNPTLRLIKRRVFTLTSAILSSTNVGIVCDPSIEFIIAALIEQIDDGQNGQRDQCSLSALALLQYGILPQPIRKAASDFGSYSNILVIDINLPLEL